MSKKLLKAKLRVRCCPPAGTPEFDRWKSNISTGMRRAKRRRRAAGLLTFTEVAVKLCLPVGAIKTMAEDGQFVVVEAGRRRRYIRESEVERWKARTGETAA